MGRADFLRLGDWNACCDRCGRKRKGSDLKKTWNGLYVCSEHWEPRHPQDFVKAVREDPTPPFVRKCSGIRLGDRAVTPGAGELVLGGGGSPTVAIASGSPFTYHHLTFTGAGTNLHDKIGDYYLTSDFAQFGTYCEYIEDDGPNMFPFNTPVGNGNLMVMAKKIYISIVFDYTNYALNAQVDLYGTYPVSDLIPVPGVPYKTYSLSVTGVGNWIRDAEIIITPGNDVVCVDWGTNLAQNQCAFDNIRYYTFTAESPVPL